MRAISSVGSEHLPYKQGVTGSNPVSPTKRESQKLSLFYLMLFFFYILYSKQADKYYIGYTKNLVGRLSKHNSKHSGFTGRNNDWKIVYKESYTTKTAAFERERQVKKWKNRQRIESLISNGSEHPDS